MRLADLETVAEKLTQDDRCWSLTSNGQPLGERIRRKILGKNIELNVSIDASTAGGYARYRDDKFALIIENLERLCQEKRAHRNLPHVAVSYIVMQSNRHEVPGFLALTKKVGVDRVLLRSLYEEDCLSEAERRRQRPGGLFDYDRELLPLAALMAIGREAQARAAELDLDLIVDWTNFVANHGPRDGRPLCSEPWKSAYVINRGIIPCAFGRKPVARWRDAGDKRPAEFVRDVLNGPVFREMRRELA